MYNTYLYSENFLMFSDFFVVVEKDMLPNPVFLSDTVPYPLIL